MVYVLSKTKQPLMPTMRYGKVRRMLKSKQAKVVKHCPFTIQLMYESTTHTQPVSLGVDAGSKTIGLSATTETTVLYEAETILRNNIVDLLSTRSQNRRSRRNHKTRYRQARFSNRTHSKHKGWLAPSVQEKVDTHLTVVRKVCEILPVSKIIVEVAAFDTQKLKNPDISSIEYQQGEQMGFWNTREYVLFRDNHTCQCCRGKSKDKVLNVHHIESHKIGGNAPNNLVTLCETCHKDYHAGAVTLPETIHRGVSFRDATFMGIMRWAFYNKLKETYSDVHLTYGYITKYTRINNNLPKAHYIDARCISGNPQAVSNNVVYYQRKVRCHNRQIHKSTILKGGVRKRNQAPYMVKGFRLFDKVLYQHEKCFIFGRRIDGRFAVRYLDGTKINEQLSFKKLRLIETRKNILCERRMPLLVGTNPEVPAAI